MDIQNLKYKCELTLLGADLSRFRNEEIYCWRFVFDDLNDHRNFTPVYVLNKARFESDFKNNHPEISNGFALSLFNSAEALKQRFAKLNAGKRKFPKLIGHNAAYAILNNCGLSDDPAPNGHLSLHEFRDVDFTQYFTIDKQVLGGDN